jgi:YVTN family beta-propeller protein
MIGWISKSLPLIVAAALTLVWPAAEALARSTGYIFVSSEDDDVVTVLQGGSLKKVKDIHTAQRPRGMGFSPDHRFLYVACGDGNSVDVIDVAKLKDVDRLFVGEDPEAFDLSLKTKQPIGYVGVGPEPEGVLVAPDGKTVYVTSEVASMVHVIDTKSLAIKNNIIVGTRPRRLALTPDGKELWVTNEIGGSISIIDTATNKVIEQIIFQPEGFRAEDITPVGIVMTKDGSTAYVAMGGANHVAVIDVKSREVTDYVLVGVRPWNVALTDDEKTLYVANGLSDDMSVIDTDDLTVTRSVPVARTPYAVAIDD